MKHKNIPPCLGYRDEWDGDFGCEYATDIPCDDCLCNYDITGGTINPLTGKKVKVED